uniref:Probable DNA polymerase n=1 Tax=Clavaria fumosa TaxID=264083 RepID=A0A7T3PCP6_9AGAR|nr:hypothetical protein KQ422_mgp109 [Clavaria fumosa]QPZ51091.1 hypothetical protein [Clavaria fumosa]
MIYKSSRFFFYNGYSHLFEIFENLFYFILTISLIVRFLLKINLMLIFSSLYNLKIKKIKMNNQSNLINKWLNYYYELDNNLITEKNIKEAFNSFWIDKINTFKNDFIIVVQFKVKTTDNFYKSISHVQMDYIKNKENILNMFLSFWTIKYEGFYSSIREDRYSFIVFNYKILSKDSLVKPLIHKKELLKLNNSKLKNSNINGYYLPNTMDFHIWGEIIYLSKTRSIVRRDSNSIYFINIFKNKINVQLKSENKLLVNFEDIKKEEDNLLTFKRTINDLDHFEDYFYVNGEIKLKTNEKKTPFLSQKEKEINMNNKFLTMDLETRQIKGELIPYCVSIYNGKSSNSFYLSDYKNSEEMVKDGIKWLMRKKYNKYKIYLHNFSYFDGIFIIKILASLTTITLNPIIKNGRIINFPFRFYSDSSKKEYVLYFRDSYLILPSSLRKLSLSFSTESKGIFPYNFINNSNISLLYEGIVPKIDYFDNIGENEYNTYCKLFKNNNWNLKKESIKYCENDCIVLYNIIKNFNLKIFNLFKINIHKYPTLPSLSLAIYRSNFLFAEDNLHEKYKIPLIKGNIYNNLKEGYTGGSVDIYKPYGEMVFRYDVNSLYPSVMKDNPMPTGFPLYFEGDISLLEKKPFGIFEVEITSPNKLEIPILQLRFKMDKGFKTISPLGKWSGWYFSEELYNALENGYSYKILRGYFFDIEYILFLYL